MKTMMPAKARIPPQSVKPSTAFIGTPSVPVDGSYLREIKSELERHEILLMKWIALKAWAVESYVLPALPACSCLHNGALTCSRSIYLTTR